MACRFRLEYFGTHAQAHVANHADGRHGRYFLDHSCRCFFTGVFCQNHNRQTRPFLENHPASHRFTVALDGCLRKHIKRSFQAA